METPWVVFIVCFFAFLPQPVAAAPGPGSSVIYTFVAIICVLILFGLFWMWYANTYRKKLIQSGPEKKHSRPVELLLFFIEHLLLEIIGLIYTIIGIISMEQQNWEPLDITGARVSFYVFTVTLKYLLVGLNLYFEHKDDNLRITIANKLHLRADWPETLDAIIFIPAVLTDGVIINAEYYLGGQSEDIVPYDTIILFVLDSLLYVKLMMAYIVRVWTEDGRYEYDIKNIVLSSLSFAYTMCMLYLFIVAHLNSIYDTGMDVTYYMIVCLLSALTHFYISSYSSMIASNILALDKMLKGSSSRIDQLNTFIRYFQNTPFWIFAGLCCYGYCLYLYISVWVVTQHLVSTSRSEDYIQTSIAVLLVVTNILNFFFMANWCFAVLKRLGTWVGCRAPFDCTAYAQSVNLILQSCGAGFRMDTHMQVARGR